MPMAATAAEKKVQATRKLVLFDIDGTLIKSRETGYTAILMEKYFGIKPYESCVYGEGKMYSSILRERLEESGIRNPERDPRFRQAIDDDSVARQFSSMKFEKVPYVEKFLKMLIRNGHTVGILTGNTEQMARVKLKNVKLMQYFSIVACDSCLEKRSDLVPIAVQMAKERIGTSFDKPNIYLIGDTVQDIKCGREQGVKTIAVATGKETFEKLSRENPYFVFRDFRNGKHMLSLIELGNSIYI